jgi:hypothetical protein
MLLLQKKSGWWMNEEGHLLKPDPSSQLYVPRGSIVVRKKRFFQKVKKTKFISSILCLLIVLLRAYKITLDFET